MMTDWREKGKRREKAILFAGDRVLSEKEGGTKGGSEWANEGVVEEEGAQHLSQGRVVFNAKTSIRGIFIGRWQAGSLTSQQ